MANRNTTGLRRNVSSAQFERRLFRAYPQWHSLAKYREIANRDGEREAFLYVHVPSANPKVSDPLSIDTDESSVIVTWFHGMHNHFDWQRDYQQAAIEHIAHILSDEETYSILRSNGKHIVRSWLGGHDAD